MIFVFPNKCGRPERSPFRAFTLIELLAVITAIAILVTLSSASFKVVRKKSQTIKCVSNLRQIGVAFGLYLSDHDMYFPPTPNENQILVGGQKGTYPGYDQAPETRPLNAYVNGNYRIFKCPADVGYRNNSKRENMQPIFKGKTYFDILGSSYRYNAKDIFGVESLTKVKKPANAV